MTVIYRFNSIGCYFKTCTNVTNHRSRVGYSILFCTWLIRLWDIVLRTLSSISHLQGKSLLTPFAPQLAAKHGVFLGTQSWSSGPSRFSCLLPFRFALPFSFFNCVLLFCLRFGFCLFSFSIYYFFAFSFFNFTYSFFFIVCVFFFICVSFLVCLFFFCLRFNFFICVSFFLFAFSFLFVFEPSGPRYYGFFVRNLLK